MRPTLLFQPLLNYRSQALHALELFQGFQNHRVKFGGASVAILPPRVWRQLEEDQRVQCRRVALQRLIYEHFFSAASPNGEVPARNKARVYSQNKELIAALTAANTGQGTSEAGWEKVVIENTCWLSDGRCLLKIDTLDNADVILKNRDSKRSSGQVTIPKHFLARSPGFYLALGNKNLGPQVNALIRVYFNATPEGVIVLMNLLTRELNAQEIAFHFKVSTQNPIIERRDSAVLYLSTESLEKVLYILSQNKQLILSSIMDGVPPFTLPLMPGVALAEDPADGQSFGLSRSMLLACALERYGTALAQKRSADEFITLLEEEFALRGATLSMPYINSEKENPFKKVMGAESVFTIIKSISSSEIAIAQNRLTGACNKIAHELCATSIWSGSTCTWLAPRLTEGYWPELPYQTLGPDLYDGTSGVALFLAAAYQHFGNDLYAKTAQGAARYALSAVANPQKEKSTQSAGMFTGWSGACLAAALVGNMLADSNLTDSAVAQALKLIDQQDGELDCYDLIEGMYGRIIALAHLAKLTKNLNLRSITQADIKHIVFDRKPQLNTTALPLQNEYGLAHGQHSELLAVIAAHTEFIDRAQLTSYIGKVLQNLHQAHQDLLNQQGSAAENISWCRGAIGHVATLHTALTFYAPERIAQELTPERQRIAQLILNRLKIAIEDIGLCHGVTGQASVLALTRPYGAAVGTDSLCDEAIYATTQTLLTLLFNTDRLCTLGRFAHPSLMQGLSGVGLFLLQQLPGHYSPLALILAGQEIRSAQRIKMQRTNKTQFSLAS